MAFEIVFGSYPEIIYGQIQGEFRARKSVTTFFSANCCSEQSLRRKEKNNCIRQRSARLHRVPDFFPSFTVIFRECICLAIDIILTFVFFRINEAIKNILYDTFYNKKKKKLLKNVLKLEKL